jgi:hydroxyacylglutathione hydrolase
MRTEQFENSFLFHFSYAVISGKEMVIIDPGRDPEPYLEAAARNGARITHVIETHPHADFVSCHYELYERTGATLHISKVQRALYPHTTFDDGDEIRLATGTLKALNTPGHSPDSISILAEDAKGRPVMVFTGDTLFMGDCGRPDLREDGTDPATERHTLARQMYHSLREKLMALPDDVVVYPAHGAGSLCGKGLREGRSSTIGEEKQSNWSLVPMDEDRFTEMLLAEQPFTPAYFPHDVRLNRNGAQALAASTAPIGLLSEATTVRLAQEGIWMIDTRSRDAFAAGHLPGAVLLMEGLRFETWLGTIVKPGEPFVLIGEDETTLRRLVGRVAEIGYEQQLRGFSVIKGQETEERIPLEEFRQHPEWFTIIDVRQESETKARQVFAGAISMPLHTLRDRWQEIPTGKPVVIHCAGGYRSAAATSILQHYDPEMEVYDLGEAIQIFVP